MRQRPIKRQHDDDEAGASLVEFALVLPLVMALILGLVTGGVAYNRKLSLTSAVREAARFGATLAVCTTSSCDTATWTTKVTRRAVELSGGELKTSDVCASLVTVTVSPDTSCGVTTPVDAPPGSHVAKISATRQAKLEVFFFSQNLTLTSRTAARYEREPQES